MGTIVRKMVLMASLAVGLHAMGHGEDWGQFGRYAESNKEVVALPAASRKVVFIGNSITDHWASIHPDFFKNNGFVGRGISGQTSYQMLVRFREDVIGLHPAAVVINAGTNDVAENNHKYDEDRTFGNIVSMVELAKAAGIQPVMTSVLPALSFPWRSEIKDAPKKIKSLNKRLKHYANTKGIAFIDYYTPMALDTLGALNPEYTDDGVHPVAVGYDVMERLALDVLGKLKLD